MPDHQHNPSPTAVEPGATIGPYRVASVVADGPSGILYEAVETASNRRVALRHLPDRLAHDPPALDKFLTAAGLGLNHANVIPTLRIERQGDDAFLVTDFVGGRIAGASGGRMPWRVATRIIRDAARGLAAIHNAGLVHGQIKPSHLIVAHDGAVKIADLGLAGTEETPENPECTAPEQVRGNPPDARTDLYGLGATYFSLLTGRPPFADAGNPTDIFEAILHKPVPTVRTGSPDTPLRCDAIVQKAMAKDPTTRYPSAETMLADLDSLLAMDEPRRPMPLPKLPPPRSWWRSPAILVGAVTVAVAAGAWYLYGPSLKPAAPVVAARPKEPPKPAVTNSIGMGLARVPAGPFVMGDSTISDARPPHIVQINRTFLIGVTEVKQSEYRAVVGDNPSQFVGANRPVDSVTWDEANAFCEKLSARPAEQTAGRFYRLPTEAEWEYACRAGTKTNFSHGSILPPEMANTRRSGWQATTEVGIFPPSPLGLFDIHGNVCEWCSDWYASQYYAVASPLDPLGPRDGLNRVTRGGSWASDPGDCRSGSRGSLPPDKRNPTVGFRVVCVEGSN